MLEKYNHIWEKVKSSIKKEFDSEPAYNEKYIKTKIKSYKGKINTNFHNNKLPKEGSQCICLSVILINSVFRTGKSYYPQVFLEECKYVVKEKKIPEYITDGTEFLLMTVIEKFPMKTILMKKILIKKILMKEIKPRMYLVFIFLIS